MDILEVVLELLLILGAVKLIKLEYVVLRTEDLGAEGGHDLIAARLVERVKLDDWVLLRCV